MAEITIASRHHGICHCFVDDEDYPRIKDYKWYVTKPGYVATMTTNPDGTIRQSLKLHRVIMNAPKGIMVDHRNGNKLDNRRENLRLCNRSSNGANRLRTHKTGGVVWDAKGNRWTVHVGRIYRGSFRDHNAALNCYNHYAILKYGEFASPNQCVPMSREEWQSKRIRRQYSSRYTNISWCKNHKAWLACIHKLGHYIGYFKTEEEASAAYNEYITTHSLNIPLSIPRESDPLD